MTTTRTPAPRPAPPIMSAKAERELRHRLAIDEDMAPEPSVRMGGPR